MVSGCQLPEVSSGLPVWGHEGAAWSCKSLTEDQMLRQELPLAGYFSTEY